MPPGFARRWRTKLYWLLFRFVETLTGISLPKECRIGPGLRIWHFGGRQFNSGRDMTCYNGSPDVDYVKAAAAFGVDGEAVKEPTQLKGAIERGRRAVAEGRPYLLDIDTWRDGIGAASTWHPPYSVADLRTRKV